MEILVGSDTTATALSAALFYLARNPSALATLQNEIRTAFTSLDAIVGGKELTECHFLRACIDEAMRLAPPVPGLLPREVVGKEGITIDGVFLPCGVRPSSPRYRET